MSGRGTVLGVAHSAPDFEVPAGACDCHVHVFAPPGRFPFAPDRLYTPGPATVEDLLALQGVLGLQRVVVVQATPYGADNSCLLDALGRLGPRGRGIAVIDGATADAALGRMHEMGVRGLRVNLETRGQRDPATARTALLEAATRAGDQGWHVQIYAGLSVLASLHDTILRLPVTLAVDHFGRPRAADGTGQPGFVALLSLLRRGNVYVKLSATYRISDAPDYGDAAAIARALIDANPDRVLWGTDWPHTGRRTDASDPKQNDPFRPEDDGRALKRLRSWAPDPVRLHKILVENPARLYGF